MTPRHEKSSALLNSEEEVREVIIAEVRRHRSRQSSITPKALEVSRADLCLEAPLKPQCATLLRGEHARMRRAATYGQDGCIRPVGTEGQRKGRGDTGDTGCARRAGMQSKIKMTPRLGQDIKWRCVLWR